MICYIGQKLHRLLSSSAWKQLVSIWDSHSEWSWNIILWSLFVSQPSTVRVTKFSCCAASRLVGTVGAPHAPESAWQAVNHVRSFICQSPPKCRAVTMDDSHPSHLQLQLSGWAAAGVSKSAFTVWGFWLITSTQDDFTPTTSSNEQFSPTPDGHWAILLLSFIRFIWQPHHLPATLHLPWVYFYRHALAEAVSARLTQWGFFQTK